MTTNTVGKFNQNPSQSVKWFLYNSLHIYRELLLTAGVFFVFLVDMTSNFLILCTKVKVYLYNYSYWVELSMDIHEGNG